MHQTVISAIFAPDHDSGTFQSCKYTINEGSAFQIQAILYLLDTPGLMQT